MAEGTPSWDDLVAMPPRRMSMGLALSWNAAREPDRPALSIGERTYSRRELDEAANRLARALQQRGVGRDDRVAVILPTGPSHQIACFAVWKCGATVIPLPYKMPDIELQQLLAHARPKLVIGSSAERAPGFEVLPEGFEPDPSLCAAPLPEAAPRVWRINPSGGSTGVPKLIVDRSDGLMDPTEGLPVLDLLPGDVLLHPAAAHHNAAITFTNWSLCWGCHLVLMARFDPEAWLQEVPRRRVTWAYLVPTMMSRILRAEEGAVATADLSSLRRIFHTAAACPRHVKQGWIDRIGPEKVYEMYGGTEAYGAVMITGQEWLAHKGSIGRPPPGTEVRGEDGAPVAPGEIGMIWFAAPDGGEPRSYGDLGWVDGDGYLYLADRRTDMIVSGGVNLYPAEIEGAIEQHPAVTTAAVVGLPDADLGARAHAILELAPGQAPPEAPALKAFLAERLTPYKIPYGYEIVDGPIRDEAGKVRRQKLREERLEGVSAGVIRLR